MQIGKNTVVAVVGLGYVGLPLAVEFGKKYRTIGYDRSEAKIEKYQLHIDPTGELRRDELAASSHLVVTADPAMLAEADVIVVAVPTPVDTAHVPDLTLLASASAIVGRNMKRDCIVVFESTVYPGATEEFCIPLLEEHSGLVWKKDFHVGYSPERVNPGDKERTITRIVKVVSGDDENTLTAVSALYGSIISAGIYRAASVKVAEAAKVIENTQRDLNIALMNELAIIFHRMGIDTAEVLEAAGTKWNFLPFRPGLVGGHCIGVDPYYLTHKAEMLGYHPEVILAGRRINDGMANFIAQQTIKQMIGASLQIKGAKVVVLGLTFKENCKDLRNSKVAEVVTELRSYGCEVIVHDPIADAKEALDEYGLELTDWDALPQAGVLVAAVSHQEYVNASLEHILCKLQPGGVFIDIKAKYSASRIEALGYRSWHL